MDSPLLKTWQRLTGKVAKKASCVHEKYQENMACDGICLRCGKNLGFIQPLRESNPAGETGIQSWDHDIIVNEQ